jgi:hypothetical protein
MNMTTKTKKTIPMPTPTGPAPELTPESESPQIVTATVNLGVLNRAIGMAVEALRKDYPETAKTVLEIAQQSILQERVK